MLLSKRPGRPKADANRDLRSELLNTSRGLLDESGPAALSMREVARRAGCTHQAPYHYFEDRESILAALVIEGFDELTLRLRAANELQSTKGVRAALVASGKAYLDFALSHPGSFRVMFRPDMCKPERFPAVQAASMRARAELDRLNQIAHGKRASAALSTILWAHVHGQACLLLDGPLALVFSSKKQLTAHLHEVAQRFADIVLDA